MSVPEHLIDAILKGRCIAFVGAGFAAPVVPSWRELLEQLGANNVPAEASAFDYEAIGQQLQDQLGAEWEPRVRAVLAACRANRGAAHETMQRRVEHLLGIPFRAILTTNFDDSLAGEPTEPDTYWRILRAEATAGWLLPDNMTDPVRKPPIIKLHGDANGDPSCAPLVFGRADYRRLVHAGTGYANFVRAAFAQYTVLFIGVSFTDAYLNELRSEVLAFLHRDDRHGPPWGYAVLVDKSPDIVEFFRKHESIEVLPAADFAGVDAWLHAICEKTSVRGRLRTLLAGTRILWVDANPSNNKRGVELFRRCGAEVTQLVDEAPLDEPAHAGADLLITHYGHDPAGTPRAVRVLDRVKSWAERPPVVVFASAAAAVRDNRVRCMRRGAFEYTTRWSELYRTIELLFGRAPGA